MILDYKVIQEKFEWDSTLNGFSDKDIHFEYNYFDLYTNEGEEPIMIYIKTDIGEVVYAFMLRDISFHSDLGDRIEKGRYFDVSTPYGFGGPLIETEGIDNRSKLIELLYNKLSEFYKEHNVVSEFIRFSPIIKNHENMEQALEVVYLKKVVATDLKEYAKEKQLGLKKGRRQSINRAKRRGLKAVFERAPKSFDRQMDIYYDTMNRKEASEAFFFPKEYFEKMLNTLSEKLLVTNVMLRGKTIGFGLSFLSEGIMYAHIGGNYREYMKYSPSDLDYAKTMKWGCENGYKYFFSGGGTTCSEEDSLYLYKKSFSNIEFDFYIGKKIWNEEDYEYLVSISNENVDKNAEFFPQYREH